MAAVHEAAIRKESLKTGALRRADLARATGCNLETIRYYETAGILPPPARTDAGHRTYDSTDVQRLRFVLRARELGFSLDDIRGLLGLGDGALRSCAEVREKTEVHLADVRSKISDLRRIEAELSRTISMCSGESRPECAILDSLWHPDDSRQVATLALRKESHQPAVA
jgi:MerR family mercuric resistance operon transcriptional regulator